MSNFDDHDDDKDDAGIAGIACFWTRRLEGLFIAFLVLNLAGGRIECLMALLVFLKTRESKKGGRHDRCCSAKAHTNETHRFRHAIKPMLSPSETNRLDA